MSSKLWTEKGIKIWLKTIVLLIRSSDQNFIYQQDNASVHCVYKCPINVGKEGVDVMEWPACSPDLNPIYSCVPYAVRKVYEGGKNFLNFKSLKDAILDAWKKFSKTLFENLTDSMKKMMFEVVTKQGKTINCLFYKLLFIFYIIISKFCR